ncbi:MAG: kelch repeat-containing protein [Candidatus Acidiferrales bacterium]
MKVIPALTSIASVMMLGLALSACSSKSAPTFTVGGTVVNLVGTGGGGLVLQDNLQDNLTVNANGSFTFANAVSSGGLYSVTISAQPSNPAQTCGVSGGSGIATADVTNIVVDCSHNEWTWIKGPKTATNNGIYGTLDVPAVNNNPGGRQMPLLFTDNSGNLWLFGGYGYDSVGTLLPMNDLWKFSSGQWTWMGGSNLGGQKGSYGTIGIPAIDNIPGARSEAVGWTDPSGNFWLFGGNGYDSAGAEASLNDLWKYSAGEWTWMSGATLANQPGAYGVRGVAAANNVPGSRMSPTNWVDSSGNLWLFGGFGYDSAGTRGSLNDLWKYSNGEWTWESGSKLVNQIGVYGTQGVPAPGNIPGARNWSVTWTDLSGNLWLFGGVGYGATGVTGLLNDLWKYSNGRWTWVSGSPLLDQVGVYGSLGVTSSGNFPGSRQVAVGWTDSSGNFWLFGGNGIDSAAETGLLNDMWKFSGGEWTWMSGSKLVNQSGVYGVQGMPAPGNIPGARTNLSTWMDAKGNLWLFGGYGVAGGSEGDLSDLWMYLP